MVAVDTICEFSGCLFGSFSTVVRTCLIPIRLDKHHLDKIADVKSFLIKYVNIMKFLDNKRLFAWISTFGSLLSLPCVMPILGFRFDFICFSVLLLFGQQNSIIYFPLLDT